MLRNVSRLPCLYKHVALMPDAHLGIGSMVGSVIATKDAVIPATVGVDIGCGMAAIKTPFKSGILDGKLKDLRHQIERTIPVGFNEHKEAVDESLRVWKGWKNFGELARGVQAPQRESDETARNARRRKSFCRSLSRYGRLRLADAAFSGSRNIGNEIASRHIETAKSLHKIVRTARPESRLFYSRNGRV